MKFRHYAPIDPVEEIDSVLQIDTSGYKPRGFWVSDDDAEYPWPKWCRENEYADSWPYIYSVELNLKDVLLLQSEDDLLRFTQRYGSRSGTGGIYWKDVADNYQGIVITPYVWKCRLSQDTRWYYPWDCASGCIWDSEVVLNLTLEEECEDVLGLKSQRMFGLT